MQTRTSQSIKQIDSDTPARDDNEGSKLISSVKRFQQIRALMTADTPRKTIFYNQIDQAPLREYNPNKALKRQITFDQVNDEELERFKADWHWNFFFEFLLYHLIFYIILGPFMVLIFFKYPGIILLKNMRFLKHHLQFYIQTILWMGSTIGGTFYFLQGDSVVTFTEIIFMWFIVAIRSVVISAKYATLSEERIKLYKTEELPEEMFTFDLMLFDWYKQTPKVLFLEQYRSLRRHEQECSLYKFDFLLQPHEKTIEAIKQTDVCFYIEWAMKQQMKQTDPLFDEYTYNGFHIFGYIVGQYQKHYTQFDLYILILSIIFAITPVMLRLHHFMENVPSGFDCFRLVINILTSMMAFYGSIVFLAIGIYDFRRKFFILDQCLYMLQAKKVSYSSSKKLIPTINFNNPLTLQAWSIMRSLAFDYGQTYNLRTQGFYSLVFVANIILIFLSLALVLDLIHIDWFQMALLGEMALILIGFTTWYLYLGAALNDYFDDFETLLEDVKSIYLDIQRMREQYFTNNIQPINDVHKIFVGILKDQVKGEADDIKEYIELIIDEIENNLRQLLYDKRNHPFKLYGVVITFNLLKSVGVGLSTIFSFAIQQRLQNTCN